MKAFLVIFLISIFSLFTGCQDDYNCTVYIPPDIDTPDMESKLFIGDKIYAVVGDTLKIYFRSIIFNHESDNYGLSLKCDKGANYASYWKYIPNPEDVGDSVLQLQIYDFNGNIIDEKEVTLITKEAKNPQTRRNILCLGNSLMSFRPDSY